jgi:hypothetical protein
MVSGRAPGRAEGDEVNRTLDMAKKPRLFYWEEAEDCWCPADGLSIENIVSLDMLDAEEVQEIRFKRIDMTDAEFEAMPEV